MKKSTLITTIAMIVVVVVALSTATYAWFSSSTQNYVAQEIQVESATGLTVLTNSVNLSHLEDEVVPTVSFDSTALLSNTQYATGDQPGIRSGLWTPTADIAGLPTANTTSASVTAQSTFLSGRKSATGVFTFEAEALTSPDLIIVTNNMTTARKVTLTIYIGAQDNDFSKLAAQGVCVYIAGVEAESKVAYTKYGKATYSTTDPANSYHEVGYKAGTGFTDAAGLNHYVDGNDDIGVYTTAWSSASVVANSDSDPAKGAGISTGYKYYTLTYEVCASLGVGQSKVFYVYSWLDGLYLDDYAKGANINIGFSFGQSEPSV